MNPNYDINNTSTYTVGLFANSANQPSASSSPESTFTNPDRLSTSDTFFSDHDTQLQVRKATTTDLQTSSYSTSNDIIGINDSNTGGKASIVSLNQPELSSSFDKLLNDPEFVSYGEHLMSGGYSQLTTPTNTPITPAKSF